jgi:uncharacterized RDD family membrane protein YckC
MSAAAPRPASALDTLQRELITPEGVDLKIGLATAGERAGAFLIDAVIILGVMIAAALLLIFTGVAAKGQGFNILAILWLLGFFLLRNGWFLAFELGPRAATPGKRVYGLRVAARSGGALTADAIFARNAMREIEVFLPLTFLGANAGGVDGWIALMGLLWSGIFALFPLFNRDRLRVGDLVAGTWVVKEPRRKLVADLAEGRAPRSDRRFAFTTTQLDAYGVKELQVLEDVLRQNQRAPMEIVANRIRQKITWAQRPDETDASFLEAYYSALRAHLESRLLMGRRRRDKHDLG